MNRAFIIISALWLLALLGVALQGTPETWGALMCGERQPRFLMSGNPQALPQARVGEQAIALVNRDLFPFDLPGFSPFELARHQLSLYNLAGDEQFAFTLPVDGDTASIARVAIGPSHFLVWASIGHRDPDTRERKQAYRRWLVDMQGNASDLAGPAHFEPFAINSTGELLASLARRVPIMGGQPAEADRPPQELKIESLPTMSTVASINARRVLGAYFDQANNLYLLRWVGEYIAPYSVLMYHIVLDKHAAPNYGLLWSTTATQEPTQQGSGSAGPHVLLTPGSSTINVAYGDEAPDLVTKVVELDADTGSVLHRSQEAYSMLRIGRNVKQEVAGLQWRSSGTHRCLYPTRESHSPEN